MMFWLHLQMVRRLLSFLLVLVIILGAFASATYISYGYKSPTGYTWGLSMYG